LPDDMFFSEDSKSLRRGRRVRARTKTCRPCLLWPKDAPDLRIEGIVLDMTPFGLQVRMIESVARDTEVVVQLMRDERFREPLARPLIGTVVRNEPGDQGFVDHGVKLRQESIRKTPSRPVNSPRKPGRLPYRRTRMHTIDLIVGDSERHFRER